MDTVKPRVISLAEVPTPVLPTPTPKAKAHYNVGDVIWEGTVASWAPTVYADDRLTPLALATILLGGEHDDVAIPEDWPRMSKKDLLKLYTPGDTDTPSFGTNPDHVAMGETMMSDKYLLLSSHLNQHLVPIYNYGGAVPGRNTGTVVNPGTTPTAAKDTTPALDAFSFLPKGPTIAFTHLAVTLVPELAAIHFPSGGRKGRPRKANCFAFGILSEATKTPVTALPTVHVRLVASQSISSGDSLWIERYNALATPDVSQEEEAITYADANTFRARTPSERALYAFLRDCPLWCGAPFPFSAMRWRWEDNAEALVATFTGLFKAMKKLVMASVMDKDQYDAGYADVRTTRRLAAMLNAGEDGAPWDFTQSANNVIYTEAHQHLRQEIAQKLLRLNPKAPEKADSGAGAGAEEAKEEIPTQDASIQRPSYEECLEVLVVKSIAAYCQLMGVLVSVETGDITVTRHVSVPTFGFSSIALMLKIAADHAASPNPSDWWMTGPKLDVPFVVAKDPATDTEPSAEPSVATDDSMPGCALLTEASMEDL